jgi:hypothetical protein
MQVSPRNVEEVVNLFKKEMVKTETPDGACCIAVINLRSVLLD